MILLETVCLSTYTDAIITGVPNFTLPSICLEKAQGIRTHPAEALLPNNSG